MWQCIHKERKVVTVIISNLISTKRLADTTRISNCKLEQKGDGKSHVYIVNLLHFIFWCSSLKCWYQTGLHFNKSAHFLSLYLFCIQNFHFKYDVGYSSQLPVEWLELNFLVKKKKDAGIVGIPRKFIGHQRNNLRSHMYIWPAKIHFHAGNVLVDWFGLVFSCWQYTLFTCWVLSSLQMT